MIQAIETRYAGHRFRSRLEARWAVFFDALGIKWQYEPQGFHIGPHLTHEPDAGVTPREWNYLPDFLLPECGTWVEVKGSGNSLDKDLMCAAAEHLPEMPYQWEPGPRLLILGPLPEARDDSECGDWGWLGLGPFDHHGETHLESRHYGFGLFRKNKRPWVLIETSCATAYDCGEEADDWLIPAFDPTEPGAEHAYTAARSARFEHGESG